MPYRPAVLLAALWIGAAAPARAQDEDLHFEEPVPHLRLTAWGGGSVFTDQGGALRGWFGAEAGWLLDRSTLSLLYEQHRGGPTPGDRAWNPVALFRWEQRFESQPGLEAGLVLGVGAGKPRDWVFWYHLAVVARMVRDPWFLSCELGLERNDAVRMAAGVGVVF